MRDELLKTFLALMNARGEVILPASGLSMYPYILPEDECRFVPIAGRIRPGQIGLFVSAEGVLTSHRFHRAETGNEGERYCLRGDGNFVMDVPVGREQVIGVLSELKRNGKIISERRLARRLWSRWSVRFPKLLSITARASELRARRETAGTAEGGRQDASSNRFLDPSGGQASRRL
ncbi:hypothetical protein [Cohnella thailandensis]|uniref:Peptidase S24/S26A/S26B/S26C domain-containing protein n=1 Tax=Cohnella thailandensis TaxID=557557 RepID=A0A841SZ38_9BACL|nr:hypothetical protein [Cohnella thailandensis]MBB6635100.1 hypothetical protein [Cohnella thailandensis]MBP1974435.1 signal peptidase [Cohnella thailandensis]